MKIHQVSIEHQVITSGTGRRLRQCDPTIEVFIQHTARFEGMTSDWLLSAARETYAHPPLARAVVVGKDESLAVLAPNGSLRLRASTGKLEQITHKDPNIPDTWMATITAYDEHHQRWLIRISRLDQDPAVRELHIYSPKSKK